MKTVSLSISVQGLLRDPLGPSPLDVLDASLKSPALNKLLSYWGSVAYFLKLILMSLLNIYISGSLFGGFSGCVIKRK